MVRGSILQSLCNKLETALKNLEKTNQQRKGWMSNMEPLYPIQFMSQVICPITEEACEKFDGEDCTVGECVKERV